MTIFSTNTADLGKLGALKVEYIDNGLNMELNHNDLTFLYIHFWWSARLYVENIFLKLFNFKSFEVGQLHFTEIVD